MSRCNVRTYFLVHLVISYRCVEKKKGQTIMFFGPEIINICVTCPILELPIWILTTIWRSTTTYLQSTKNVVLYSSTHERSKKFNRPINRSEAIYKLSSTRKRPHNIIFFSTEKFPFPLNEINGNTEFVTD